MVCCQMTNGMENAYKGFLISLHLFLFLPIPICCSFPFHLLHVLFIFTLSVSQRPSSLDVSLLTCRFSLPLSGFTCQSCSLFPLTPSFVCFLFAVRRVFKNHWTPMHTRIHKDGEWCLQFKRSSLFPFPKQAYNRKCPCYLVGYRCINLSRRQTVHLTFV